MSNLFAEELENTAITRIRKFATIANTLGFIPKGYWVFGFDTFHPGDNPDTCSREWCIEETNRLKNILENWNI